MLFKSCNSHQSRVFFLLRERVVVIFCCQGILLKSTTIYLSNKENSLTISIPERCSWEEVWCGDWGVVTWREGSGQKTQGKRRTRTTATTTYCEFWAQLSMPKSLNSVALILLVLCMKFMSPQISWPKQFPDKAWKVVRLLIPRNDTMTFSRLWTIKIEQRYWKDLKLHLGYSLDTDIKNLRLTIYDLQNLYWCLNLASYTQTT